MPKLLLKNYPKYILFGHWQKVLAITHAVCTCNGDCMCYVPLTAHV